MAPGQMPMGPMGPGGQHLSGGPSVGPPSTHMMGPGSMVSSNGPHPPNLPPAPSGASSASNAVGVTSNHVNNGASGPMGITTGSPLTTGVATPSHGEVPVPTVEGGADMSSQQQQQKTPQLASAQTDGVAGPEMMQNTQHLQQPPQQQPLLVGGDGVTPAFHVIIDPSSEDKTTPPDDGKKKKKKYNKKKKVPETEAMADGSAAESGAVVDGVVEGVDGVVASGGVVGVEGEEKPKKKKYKKRKKEEAPPQPAMLLVKGEDGQEYVRMEVEGETILEPMGKLGRVRPVARFNMGSGGDRAYILLRQIF